MDNAAFKIPNPLGPASRTSSAKTAKIATAPPNKTAIISKVKAPKITLSENTNLIPACRLSLTDSPLFLFKIGFLLTKNINVNEHITSAKTNPKV